MKVKNLMTPVSDYQTLPMDARLSDVATVLKESKHRDIIIVDENGAFAGVVTMSGIIMALEPNYRKLNQRDMDSDILSNRFVADQFKEFNLWTDSLATLCDKGQNIPVVEAMIVPDEDHYINIEEKLEHGVHMYIIGTPQPLVVRDNGTIVGILRMADVFDELVSRMAACASN
ncbi:CBS domain-containing protein [Pseudodesulfovibrio sediminis]|uniref:CBS domain-containing protein n=1 Tax=Pseudodesulfovibrio sediminis TaxID=2810563 RepID=A0ABM7P4J6_9BACT|nr:CBS domain-containing protein [Pseudodesulfovibrio sediminis]BCS87789.1 hypothetical protein PSDVSF_10310 [Pseudodesulfovibrio sediminis]